MTHIQLAAPLLISGWLLILVSAPALDALSLGEGTATSLGFDMGRVRLLLIVGTALSVGASVAVAGAIGFIGLVVPHLLRPLVGGRPGRLLLVSGLG
ncbi:iron chelate uptake ABC transporter family permease subunit, partial [Hansschlegelia beijingensis]